MQNSDRCLFGQSLFVSGQIDRNIGDFKH